MWTRWGAWSAAGWARLRAIAYHGGNWSNGSKAGLFYLNLNNEASNSNTNIGGRLASDIWPEGVALRGASSAVSLGAIVLPG